MKPVRYHKVPEDYAFAVLHETDDLLAVDKPAGVVVHPTGANREDNVVMLLRRQLGGADLTLIHRLDRETSGVLLVAKRRERVSLWARWLKDGSLTKTYIARVRGAPPALAGEVDAAIGQHPTSDIRVRRAILADGKASQTRYRLLKHEGATSLLELTPRTGRCHQLRVHCEWLGCPIVGDPLYGCGDDNYRRYVRGDYDYQRLHLHAWRLRGAAAETAGLEIIAPLPHFLRV